MFSMYEKLPEWLRWILFLPLFFGIMFAFSFIFRMASSNIVGTFFYGRILAPFVGGAALVYFASRLIPRAKIITSYLICSIWIPLVSLGILSFIAVPPNQGGFTQGELIQASCAFIGSLFFTLQAHKKYRKR
ncbi:hypothetical protein [Halodesulfovibrio aestuarii]|uniref:Uncharacterized protein n=1 Tax=Halodesulfovibrio aestuarii TaxID=126333 RepID=A0A8G2C894_9BACT|nr:hypothetical protein [Halodesulfovibrio aestuarii]SHI78237.1 hypothetical protein SAMN05660830_00972 [Halodesulfovibrio aestuarii]